MKKIFEKYLLLKYVVSSFIKFFLYSLVIFSVLSAILVLTGLYAGIESALDLKYNSPFILVPLFGFIALSALCLFIGFLLYFYKYKRSKTTGTFHKAFSNILDKKQINKG